MQWELAVTGAETSNEMVLEGADRAFGSIAAVNVRWGKLEVNVFFSEVVFQGLGSFIVKSLELWFESTRGVEVMSTFVGSKVFRAGGTAQELDMDAVAVVIVHEKHASVALTRWEEETASGICVEFSCG